MNILCIDDDPVILTQYERVLAKHTLPGDRVIRALTGTAGIEMAATMHFDVVFCDLVLPDLSGIEVIARIKESNPGAEVVVLTGFGSIDTAVEALKIGARDYLTKPVNATVLVEKLQMLREARNLSGDAEGYRFAGDVVEERARQEIGRLELRSGKQARIIGLVKELVSSQRTEKEKLLAIEELLSKCGEN